jgi:hypothetical protein
VPRGWRRYFRIGTPDPGAEVEEEISFHLEMRTQEYLAAGLDPAAARFPARRATRVDPLVTLRAE